VLTEFSIQELRIEKLSNRQLTLKPQHAWRRCIQQCWMLIFVTNGLCAILALFDAVRSGQARERNPAHKELAEYFQ
jgi:hypothetical protein